MKIIIALGFIVLSLASQGTAQMFTTSGANSPLVVARNFQATYGIRADAVLAILAVYQQQGLTEAERGSKTEDLIKAYRSVAPRTKGVLALSVEAQQRLGIVSQPDLVTALNWDIFAQQYYLSTSGANSPAIIAAGDVSIWYGIPEPALRTLAARLEANAVELGEFGTQLQELAEKYEALKREFEIYGPGDPIVRQVEKLLDEGRLEEAEALLESDYRVSRKRLAYKAYLLGKTKELLLKYDEAAEGYRDAVELDSGNVVYLITLGAILETLGNLDEALNAMEGLFNGSSISSQLPYSQQSEIYRILGTVWYSKGDYRKAIEYLELSMRIDSSMLGGTHPEVVSRLQEIGTAFHKGGDYAASKAYMDRAYELILIDSSSQKSNFGWALNSLGVDLTLKGEFDLAIRYLEQSLGISKSLYGDLHPNISTTLNNLGEAYGGKGEFDTATAFHLQALAIDTTVFSFMHSRVALDLFLLGVNTVGVGKYSDAAGYFDQALQIDTVVFGKNHPMVAKILESAASNYVYLNEFDKAIDCFELAADIFDGLGIVNPDASLHLSGLGAAWRLKGEYLKAIDYFEQALELDRASPLAAPNLIAKDLNNIGVAWLEINEHDKALTFIEQALAIDTIALGLIHPHVAVEFGNLGRIYRQQGQLDKSKECLNMALGIDTLIFGFDHPHVGMFFGSMGTTLRLKGEYEESIRYIEQAYDILSRFCEPWQQPMQTAFRELALSANLRGLQLMQQGNFSKALPHFEKALLNIDSTSNVGFSILCLKNIGSTRKQMGNFQGGLASLDEGVRRADSLSTAFLIAEASLTDSIKSTEKYLSQRDSLLQRPILRQLYYHKIGCLQGIGQSKSAKKLAQELTRMARRAKDEEILQLLKDDGWLKE